METQDVTPELVMSPDALLEHWQGHRRLTRRVIQAFPEDRLFTFSVGGMRPFGAMVAEMLAMAAPMVRGAATGEWLPYAAHVPETRAELLAEWDESTTEINELWAQIPPARFQETLTAFGQFTDRLYGLIFYVIDNEIHHRAQGYVYLRALSIDPPAFYERY